MVSRLRSAIVLIVRTLSAPPENLLTSPGHCLSRWEGASTSVVLTAMKEDSRSGGGTGRGTRGAASISAIVITVFP